VARAPDGDEGSRIRHRNRRTVRGLVKVLELFTPGTHVLRGHHGGHAQERHQEGVRMLATCIGHHS
jgi:hypothetical protein